MPDIVVPTEEYTRDGNGDTGTIKRDVYQVEMTRYRRIGIDFGGLWNELR
jgi:hypothetical protein